MMKRLKFWALHALAIRGNASASRKVLAMASDNAIKLRKVAG